MSENYFTYFNRARRHPDDIRIQKDLQSYIEGIADYLPDSFVEVYSGLMVNISRPTREMITLEDIAHALARIQRFNGHSHVAYTVARHTRLVVDIIRALGGGVNAQLLGWLHDMPEAYIGDVSSPLKRLLQPVYDILDRRFLREISAHLGLPVFTEEDHKLLKHADLLALLVERKVLKYRDQPTDHDWWFTEDLYTEADKFTHLISVDEPPYTKHDFMRDFNATKISNAGGLMVSAIS